MWETEHSLMDVLQFSSAENYLDVLEQSIVSQLGTSQALEANHIPDTASHDNKRSTSDALLDFSNMENAEYQFLEPFLSEVNSDKPPQFSSSWFMASATTAEESASFNNSAILSASQVPILSGPGCEQTKCIEVNLCSEEASLEIPSCANSEVEQNTVLEDNSASKSLGKILGNTGESKYLEMRRKNNIASCRSRKIRKVKDKETVEKLKKLAAENEELLKVAAKLEKQRDWLKSYLMRVFSEKK